MDQTKTQKSIDIEFIIYAAFFVFVVVSIVIIVFQYKKHDLKQPNQRIQTNRALIQQKEKEIESTGALRKEHYKEFANETISDQNAIQVQTIPDTTKQTSSSYSVSGTNINIGAYQLPYGPMMFSICPFIYSGDSPIFIKNGVKYVRCFGEKIPLTELDPKMVDMYITDTDTVQGPNGTKLFVAPDYRGKILKYTTQNDSSSANININNFPSHSHPGMATIDYTVYGPEYVGGYDGSATDPVSPMNRKDVNMQMPIQNTNNDPVEYKIDTMDSSTNFIFGLVIGYVQ